MNQAHVFHEQLLDSGVQLVGQPMGGVQSAAVGLLFGTGARDEGPEQFGVSHFVEQTLFRGTERLDARELSDQLDALGISYDSSTGMEMTLVSAVLLSDKLSAAIDLLMEVARHARFPEEDIENVRALIVQERRQREDRPAQKVMELLRQDFFAGSAMSHDVLGTEETIASLTRSDLMQYWSGRYTANNVIVSVAGHFDWESLLGQVRSATENWQTGRGRMSADAPPPRSSVRVVEREASQENLGFAFPGVSITDPRYYALALAIQALGGSSTSRLFQEVREKRGLAYAVQARFDGLEQSGIVRVYCGTSAERAHESVQVILEQLQKFARHGITEDELALSKTRLKSQVIMRSESTSARMVSNARSWWYEERLYTLDEIKEKIDSVTVEEIASLLPSLGIAERLTAVAVGPRSEDELFGGILARS